MLIRSCFGLVPGLLVFGLAVSSMYGTHTAIAAGDNQLHGQSETNEHGNQHRAGSGGDDKHRDAHQNEHDLSHANAGPQLESPAEWKADLAIYTFVVFLLLLILLWKFAWGPISEGLDQREQSIAGKIEEAARCADEAKAQLQEYQAKLSTAAEDVRALLEQARRDADMQKQEIIDQAQKSAQAEKDRALREIWAAKNQAMTELAQKSVDTAIGLAGQIVRRQLTTEEHTQLIQDALGKFPSEN